MKESDKLPIRHSSACVKFAVGCSSLEFRVELRARMHIWAMKLIMSPRK